MLPIGDQSWSLSRLDAYENVALIASARDSGCSREIRSRDTSLEVSDRDSCLTFTTKLRRELCLTVVEADESCRSHKRLSRHTLLS